MRRVDGRTEVVTDHPAARVVANPNPMMTSAEWRSYGIQRVLAHGNWLDQPIYDGDGNPLEIWPLCNDKAGLAFDESGKAWWLYKTDRVKGGAAALPYSEVLHIRGLSTDGWLGLSPIAAHKKLLGWNVSAEDFGLSFFVNGATASGVVSFPGDVKVMSEEAYRNFKRDFEQQHAGLGNSHKPIILEEGANFTPISISAENAQFLGTLKHLRSIICGIYRIPAHMVNDLEKATFANIEEQGIMYVSHTLNPWCVLIEQRLNMTLLRPEERASGYFFKHNLRGLMRGKFAEQMNSFATGIQNGVYNPNEARDLLDMNGYEGGEVYTRNSASTPVAAQQTQQTEGGQL